ncbi:MAG: IS3 family transposase [Nitrospirales bacterium]
MHSDRGTQSTAEEFQTFLKTHGIVSSMSGVGNCYDNAVAESFFGLLKRERVYPRRYRTRAEARTDIFDYIELNGSTIDNGVIPILRGCPLGYMPNRSHTLLTNLSTKRGEDQGFLL